MLLTTQGFILSYIKYNDNDVIGKIFTKEKGLLSFRIRNAFSSQKKKYTSFLKPLQKVEITLEFQSNKELHFIQNIALSRVHNEVYSNMLKSSVAMFLSEVLVQIVVTHHQDDDLYVFLDRKLQELDETKRITYFPIECLQEMSQILGFFPSEQNQHLSFFDLREGVHSSSMLADSLNEAQTQIWNDFLAGKRDFNKMERRELLHFWIDFYQKQLTSFRTIHSLAILQEIFE